MLALVFFFALTGVAFSQPTTSTATLPEQVYKPGQYESNPVALTNKAQVTHTDEIDVSALTDPKTCVVFGSDIIDKSGKQRSGGRGGVCGQPGGFKDRNGNPVSVVSISGGRIDPDSKVVSVLVLKGNSLKTKASISTK